MEKERGFADEAGEEEAGWRAWWRNDSVAHGGGIVGTVRYVA